MSGLFAEEVAPVVLPDAPTPSQLQQQHMFRCLVRHVVKLGKDAGYMLEVYEKKHGHKPNTSPLRLAAREQHAKGNRGAYDDWRE